MEPYFGGLLGALGPLLGGSWASPGPLLAGLGRSWGLLGRLLAASDAAKKLKKSAGVRILASLCRFLGLFLAFLPSTSRFLAIFVYLLGIFIDFGMIFGRFLDPKYQENRRHGRHQKTLRFCMPPPLYTNITFCLGIIKNHEKTRKNW